MRRSHDSFDDTCQDRRDRARELFLRFGPTLRASAVLRRGLAEVSGRAADLAALMGSLGLSGLCDRCGQGRRGGCCAQEMEGEAETLLLLVNLLLGVDITARRDDGFECSFLGPAGCSLVARPIYCLNYNCRQIRETLAGADLATLERATGRALSAYVELEGALRELLGRGP